MANVLEDSLTALKLDLALFDDQETQSINDMVVKLPTGMIHQGCTKNGAELSTKELDAIIILHDLSRVILMVWDGIKLLDPKRWGRCNLTKRQLWGLLY